MVCASQAYCEMKDYDPSLPLIAIHVPKTAGTSVRNIYEDWFRSGFLEHYITPPEQPKKYDLNALHSRERPVVVYGHFNSKKNFGVQDVYPEVEQFVTILRDPFDRAVSRYFYVKGIDKKSGGSSTSESELREVLRHQDPKWGMLCQFPRQVTMENYKEIIERYFIDIGTTEYLEESLTRVSKKLGKTFSPTSLPVLNVSRRNAAVPEDLREEFINANSLEYAVYNYVKSMYE